MASSYDVSSTPGVAGRACRCYGGGVVPWRDTLPRPRLFSYQDINGLLMVVSLIRQINTFNAHRLLLLSICNCRIGMGALFLITSWKPALEVGLFFVTPSSRSCTVCTLSRKIRGVSRLPRFRLHRALRWLQPHAVRSTQARACSSCSNPRLHGELFCSSPLVPPSLVRAAPLVSAESFVMHDPSPDPA